MAAVSERPPDADAPPRMGRLFCLSGEAEPIYVDASHQKA